MTAFIQAVESGLHNITTTDNGAISNKSTNDKVLDFFSKAPSLRSDISAAVDYFHEAFDENPSLALKALFYVRDVRGGQGEREIFRSICTWLACNHPDAIIRNIPNFHIFGRWDDLYTLVAHELTMRPALAFMRKQFEADMSSEGNVSLLGKWLKSENASSSASRRLGTLTRKYFGLTSRNYRKSLAELREKINIVETLMSARAWDLIDYSAVPSHAMKIYSKAFNKHDYERFENYVASVADGKEKINSSTLYPYEITRKVAMTRDETQLKVLDCQWNSLPNYLENVDNAQALVVADVSGSMETAYGSVRPIDVAISLAIYFADRLTGPFAKHFMTFSEEPDLIRLEGDTIDEKVSSVRNANWGRSTNLANVFSLILRFAAANNVPRDEMPKKIFIISDMQFNEACIDNDKSNFEMINETYKRYGYERPTLVFWNVNAQSDTPVTKDDVGTYLISGCSPRILKYAMNSKAVTPMELMMEVLNSERYKCVE